jgi:L-ribulose-5-phosphate 3-epimerase
MRVGIMQGRLSPARARPQSFPWDSWKEEFARARSYGFDLIEWLFDGVRYEENPIWTEAGLAHIQECMISARVSVESVCADYFVGHPLVRASAAERRHHLHVLNVLIARACRLGVRVILIPALEAGEIQDADEQAVFLEFLTEPLAVAGAAGITLAVESNMSADRYLDLITEARHPALGVYFDTGNRTAHGLDIVADVGRLGPHLRGVHIKDRLSGGPNVPLGDGAAPFDKFFPALADAGYSGPVVLETTVGESYEYHARRNLEFVKSRLGRVGKTVVDAGV